MREREKWYDSFIGWLLFGVVVYVVCGMRGFLSESPTELRSDSIAETAVSKIEPIPDPLFTVAAARTTDAEDQSGSAQLERDKSRSPEWPKVRARHLFDHPMCEVCGQRDHLQVHHVIPFHDDPSKELDPENLITLCTDGPGHMNCHLVIGHGGNYRCRNASVREDAMAVRAIFDKRICD